MKAPPAVFEGIDERVPRNAETNEPGYVDRIPQAVLARVIAEQAAVFGAYPDFDYGSYTFLADYLPWVSGDGMEHRNSTIISSAQPLTAQNINARLGTLIHEHFHAWNVERLRDRDLEPFDFDNADMSNNLWFGEGFTQYYTALIPTRAGYTPVTAFSGSIGNTINAVVNGPGRDHRSPIQMSQYAPFADAAVSNDATNQSNTFISYYTYGAAVALGLDLTLRTRFDLDLDGYLRALWTKYGVHQANYTPTRPYTTADLRTTFVGKQSVDLAWTASVEEVVASAALQLGGLDIVINNASAIARTPVADTRRRTAQALTGIAPVDPGSVEQVLDLGLQSGALSSLTGDAVLVHEDGKPVGVVTRQDLLAYLARP